MKDFIVIKGLDFYLDSKAILKNINLTIDSRQFISIRGANGCGKTTLSKLIIGIYPYRKGSIKIEDREVSEMSLSEIGRKIGYLFQNPEKQIFTSTVLEELSFIYKYREDIDKSRKEKEIDEILDTFDIRNLKNKSTFFLSQGEKQRVALASVLLNKPKYLILDEPTTGLDYKRKEMLSEILDKYKNKIGVLLISHDYNFVKKHSQKIISLEGGCIVYE